jgi:hypothetical protein
MIAYSGDFASMIARMPPNKGKVHISDTHHTAAFFLADGDRAELGTSAARSGARKGPRVHFESQPTHPTNPAVATSSHPDRHEAGLQFGGFPEPCWPA